jgi:hypothetical protein
MASSNWGFSSAVRVCAAEWAELKHPNAQIGESGAAVYYWTRESHTGRTTRSRIFNLQLASIMVLVQSVRYHL